MGTAPVTAVTRPTEVRAMHYDGSEESRETMVSWLGTSRVWRLEIRDDAEPDLLRSALGVLPTRDPSASPHIVPAGSWVVMDIDLELTTHVVSDEDFKADYLVSHDYAQVHQTKNGDWAWRRRDGGNHKIQGWTGESHAHKAYAVRMAMDNSGCARVEVIDADGNMTSEFLNGELIAGVPVLHA